MGKESIKLVASNKKAYFDYLIDEKYKAKIELFGVEVKPIRMGKCSVKEPLVRVDRGKVYICGMHVSPYERGNILNKNLLRMRKLLFHKYEILKVGGKIKGRGYTLVPLRVYLKGSLVRVEVELTHGKKNYGKRVDIAKKDQRRELEKDFKVKNLYQGKRKVSCDVDMGKYLEFIREVEGLESALRVAWTATGRQESMVEHSWRLALRTTVLCCEFPKLDREGVILICLVHDPRELYIGDISATLRSDEGERHRQKQLDVSRATRTISGPCVKGVMASCEEYSQDQAPEVRLVKAMGRTEMTIQYNQDTNPPDFDYESNLPYGMEHLQEDEKLEGLRTLMDEEASGIQHGSLQYGRGCIGPGIWVFGGGGFRGHRSFLWGDTCPVCVLSRTMAAC